VTQPITIITPDIPAERPIFEGKTMMTINGRILNRILRIRAATEFSGRTPTGT
jgi:hypothetical protein